ncbi:DHH family phosphoesterase [archaeon]|jgi:single-stranded-DNA-specific exonuclease|nr:DHH family phosphoesterase [archaeon]MBT3577599.1 DHH family phosphoesterase [archaeon]MBT6820147.1 DHH family phosphoesterase [archaeon]MBT6956564.1 DHH family phosphoesterase [archaeon]MBT7025695.1 DHH family phosphoesterase [archaeon]
MLKEVDRVAKEFLELSKNKPIRIVSHYDSDGITSAAILAKAFKRLDKKFSIKIVKGLEEDIIRKELSRQPKELIVFSDLASGSLEYFQKLQEPIFILDHHEIHKEQLNDKIKIINPHLFENVEDNSCTGAGVCYLFAKALSPKNADLSSLAIIGMIGDRHESNLSKINQQIINDTTDLTIRKGLVLYPATRPLRRALEYSTSPYIPGVTGNGEGVIEILRETGIGMGKSLLELDDNEMSKLITAVMIRRAQHNKADDILGNLYILKFFNTKEDVREISTLVNACSRLGYHDTAIAYCMENEKAKLRALDIYTEYKQELVSGLRLAEKMDKIKGKGFVILNAKDKIKDAIVGTICSMLSSSPTYEEGTVLIGMAYNEDKIKVSARIVGREGRNLKEVLEKTVITFKGQNPETIAEVGGHHFAAGCLVEKEKEQLFIEALKKNLEIEIVKI